MYICHECDALQTLPLLEPGHVANCVCCGSVLFKYPKGGLDRPLALTISSLIFYLLANLYPIMSLEIAGIDTATTLTGSALQFIEHGNLELALLVWLSCVFIPGFSLMGLLYVMLSIRYGLNWPFTKPILVWVSRLLPWGMMDVFLLGVLVALVKLSALADIILGEGFYAFLVLVFTYAAALSSLEPHLLWQGVDKGKENSQLKEALHE